MATTNSGLISQYRKAIVALNSKLARQEDSVEATRAQIAGFEALVAQLEGKK